jgi:ligand-binding sensor domain-containing protein
MVHIGSLRGVALEGLVLSFSFLSSCNGQPTGTAPVVITNDTVQIPASWPLPLDYEGQLCHWVRNMHQDQSGMLWFGTNHYGLIRCVKDTLEYLADSAGITTGRINGIVESADGILWVATDGEGLFRYDPSARHSARHGFSQLTTKDGLPDNAIWSMRMGLDGVLWFGTMNGLHTYDGRTFTTIDLPASTAVDSLVQLSPTRITCILEDRHGMLWFGAMAMGSSCSTRRRPDLPERSSTSPCKMACPTTA